MADLFDFIAGLHGFLEPNGVLDEQSDSDESFMESDDGQNVFEEEGDLNLWMGDDQKQNLMLSYLKLKRKRKEKHENYWGEKIIQDLCLLLSLSGKRDQLLL